MTNCIRLDTLVGMLKTLDLAEKTGLGRESLYKALDEKAHPRFETIFKVLNAMGIQMTLVPKVKFRKRSKQTELCVAEKKVRYKV